MTAQQSYIPAASRDWLLCLYDPIVKLLGGDRARQVLAAQAELRPAYRVLEVGCGTGSLLLELKRRHPQMDVVGLDPDPMALARAKRKAAADSAAIRLDRGLADALPYPDGSFDRVFSCFMFHHLARPGEKLQMLQEVRRVLKPGGRLQLLDFAPHAGRRRFLAPSVHSRDQMKDNAEQRVLSLMIDAGLKHATTVSRGTLRSMFPIVYYQAESPVWQPET